jgi:hypothetical protein
MKKIVRLFLVFIVTGQLLSCETDFDVIADYKEVAIVYGLLNQSDSVQYLRINKAFLGEGNSLSYAQVADSSTFGADINVILIETTLEGIKKEIIFDTITLSNKQPGDFYSPNQLFYYSDEPLNENNSYELKVTHKKTGYEVNAVTRLVHNFSITKPSAGGRPLSLKRSVTQPNKFIWNNAVNGKRYQFRFYFNFKELSIGSPDTVYRKIEWVFPEVVSEKTDGTGESSVGYTNEQFYLLCENKIPYTDAAAEEAVTVRYASLCDLEVTAIGDEFNAYLESNSPSTGVLIDKPVYNNITNGFGLFSCRYQINRLIPLAAETIQDLSTTTTLKFSKPN